MVLCGVHRGHMHHRDVRPDGLLEAEQLCGQSLLQRDDVLLHLRPPGSGESQLTLGLCSSFLGFWTGRGSFLLLRWPEADDGSGNY